MNFIQKEFGKFDVIAGIWYRTNNHYWSNLAEFKGEYDIKLVLVNPNHVKKAKELDDNNPTKNDLKDAKTIAQLVKNGRYSEPYIPEVIYADLRAIMTHRERLLKDSNGVKNKITRWLDIYFPEYTVVFKQ